MIPLEQTEVESELVRLTGGGFYDGGCRAFAEMIQSVHGGTLVVIANAKGIAQHAMVWSPEGLVDGGGLHAEHWEAVCRLLRGALYPPGLERNLPHYLRMFRPGDLEDAQPFNEDDGRALKSAYLKILPADLNKRLPSLSFKEIRASWFKDLGMGLCDLPCEEWTLEWIVDRLSSPFISSAETEALQAAIRAERLSSALDVVGKTRRYRERGVHNVLRLIGHQMTASQIGDLLAANESAAAWFLSKAAGKALLHQSLRTCLLKTLKENPEVWKFVLDSKTARGLIAHAPELAEHVPARLGLRKVATKPPSNENSEEFSF